jgi:hypothetical protein
MIETDTIAAPACWASALINGDCSGLEDDEVNAMNSWLAHLTCNGWQVVDTIGEPFFSWHYNTYGGTAQGGDLLGYTILRTVGE